MDLNTEERRPDPEEGSPQGALPWYPTASEGSASLGVVLVGLAVAGGLGLRSESLGNLLAGPWSAELSKGVTPSPILATGLVGGALFWVFYAYYFLPGNTVLRGAALCGLVLTWVIVGFMELVLAG